MNRLRTAHRPSLGADVGVPALIRTAGMAAQLGVLAWLNSAHGPALSDRLTKWDGLFYLRIAEHGYPDVDLAGPTGSLTQGGDYAFYPLYPVLARGLHTAGLSSVSAALVVSALAGIAAACAVHLIVVQLGGSRRAGWIAAGLLGALPMSVTLQMAYAEALYIALAAFAVLFALRGSWWLAGGFAFGAGLTRPTGLLLAAVIPVTAWWLPRLAGNRSREQKFANPGRVVGATVLALLASPLYWAFLWLRTGHPTMWFRAEKRGWDSHLDFGRQTWRFWHDTLARPDGFVAPAVCLIFLGYVVALAVAAIERQPAPLLVAITLPILLALGTTNYWHSKPRLLLGAFLLVVPGGVALAKLRPASAAVVVGAATLVSAWFGAYMLCVWPYAI